MPAKWAGCPMSQPFSEALGSEDVITVAWQTDRFLEASPVVGLVVIWLDTNRTYCIARKGIAWDLGKLTKECFRHGEEYCFLCRLY